MAHSGTATVTLVNRKRRTRPFNLPYKIAGLEFCVRQMCGRVVYDGSTGAKRVKGDNKRLSSSLTLMGKGQDGDRVFQLPPAVLGCPEIASALKAREIKAIHLTADESAKELEELTKAAAKKAKAKTDTTAFIERKADRKAAAALARSAATKAEPADPTKAELKAKAVEEERLAKEQAAIEAIEADEAKADKTTVRIGTKRGGRK